jgi:plastocyanin
MELPLPGAFVRLRALLGLAAAALLACGDDGPTDNDDTPTGDIEVGDNFFDPASFQATVGEEVVWAWSGAATHNVTFDDGPSSPDQSSGTYARTFTAAGSYPYHCTIHGAAAMSGAVTVAAGAVGGGGGPPGGDNGDPY